MSGSRRVRAGAHTQRRVRATAKRLLATQWPPPPPQRGRGAGCGSRTSPRERRKRLASRSPRSPARVHIRRACARLLPTPPPPRPTAASDSLPPHAHTAVSTSSCRASPRAGCSRAPRRWQRVRVNPYCVVVGRLERGARVDAHARDGSKRWCFREGRYRGGACRGCRAESAPARAKRGGQLTSSSPRPSARREPAEGEGRATSLYIALAVSQRLQTPLSGVRLGRGSAAYSPGRAPAPAPRPVCWRTVSD